MDALISEARRDAPQHINAVLNYCRTGVRLAVVEAINGNIRVLVNHGHGYYVRNARRHSLIYDEPDRTGPSRGVKILKDDCKVQRCRVWI